MAFQYVIMAFDVVLDVMNDFIAMSIVGKMLLITSWLISLSIPLAIRTSVNTKTAELQEKLAKVTALATRQDEEIYFLREKIRLMLEDRGSD